MLSSIRGEKNAKTSKAKKQNRDISYVTTQPPISKNTQKCQGEIIHEQASKKKAVDNSVFNAILLFFTSLARDML